MEIIVLLFIMLIAIPILCLIGIIKFIIWLVRKIKGVDAGTEKIKPEKPVKPVRHFSGSEIMFIIGTVFIVLSGIAFGCAGWVNTSPGGRVMIMMLAVAVMFGAGEVFRRVIKLNRTATAFSMTGTVLISVVCLTAGYYNIFGEWFSADGDGRYLLLATGALLTGISAYAEEKLLKNNAFKYLCYISGDLVIIFTSCQLSGNDSGAFSFIMIMVQAGMTLFYVFGEIKDDILKKFTKVSSVVFAVISYLAVIGKFIEPDMSFYAVMLILFVQLVGYGVYLDNKTLKSLQGIQSVIIAFAFTASSSSSENYNPLFALSLILTGIYIANRSVPYIRTAFSEVFTLGSAIFFSFMLIEGELYEVFIPVVISLLVMSYAVTGTKKAQVISGIFSPLMLCIIADFNDCILWCIPVFCVINILLIKFTERKTDVILYSDMYVSALCILFSVFNGDENFLILGLLCGLHILVSFMMKSNFSGIFSAIGIIYVMDEFVQSTYGYMEAYEYRMFIIFICLIVLARIFFKDKIISKSDNKKTYDLIMFSAWCIYMSIDDTFCMLMFIAVYIANTVRKNTGRTRGNIMMSLSAFMTMAAFVSDRPFFNPESEIISVKITLAIIALMGVAYRYIWRQSPKVSKILSDIIFIISFAGLIFDIINYNQAGNTILDRKTLKIFKYILTSC